MESGSQVGADAGAIPWRHRYGDEVT